MSKDIPVPTPEVVSPVVKTVPIVSKPLTIVADDLRIFPMRDGKKTIPTLVFTGDAPDVGQKVSFTLKNGVAYSGKVEEVVKVDGKILLTFVEPLTYSK